jgi:uncharacterized membrane protein YfcA
MLGRLAAVAATCGRQQTQQLSEPLMKALRSGVTTKTTTFTIAPEVLRKARLMSPPVGLLAGSFGALVGVGGGVIIGTLFNFQEHTFK